MKKLLPTLTLLCALLSLIPFLKPKDREPSGLLWMPKLLVGAFSPLLTLVSGLGAFYGFLRRDRRMLVGGLLGAGLSLAYIRQVTRDHNGFADAFGKDWQDCIPSQMRKDVQPRRWVGLALAPHGAVHLPDIVYAHNSLSGEPLHADLWQPAPGRQRSGLGLIYLHGGAWRYGSKDMGTRHFFRRLAGNGHTIMDIEYTLWPNGDIPNMLCEVRQAVLWLKQNAAQYGINPERIVLMGGSAGAHLALQAAYTPAPSPVPPTSGLDPTVHAVIAFYPPVDLRELGSDVHSPSHIAHSRTFSWLRKETLSLMNGILRALSLVKDEIHYRGHHPGYERGKKLIQAGSLTSEGGLFLARVLGGAPQDIPQIYEQLSPATHAGAHCPPTLLIQGSDDFFRLETGVRRLHQKLRKAGVPVVLSEFPHNEHAFDLILPQLSPAAQAAMQDVDRFLAILNSTSN